MGELTGEVMFNLPNAGIRGEDGEQRGGLQQVPVIRETKDTFVSTESWRNPLGIEAVSTATASALRPDLILRDAAGVVFQVTVSNCKSSPG